MNFIDFIIIAILLYAAWTGFKKGFVIELFTFLALFLALYAGIHFSDYLSTLLGNSIKTAYLPAISFTLIFLAVGAMVYFGGKAIEKVVKIVQLSLVNKFLGLFFSCLKAVFLLGAFSLLIQSYNERNEFISKETRDTSLLFNPIVRVTTFCIPAFDESTLFMKNLFEKAPNEQENGSPIVPSEPKKE